MRSAELIEGAYYLVVLPYDGGSGIARVIQTGVPDVGPLGDELPYNGHGAATVRVKWTAGASRYHRDRIQRVRANNVVRRARPSEVTYALAVAP